VQNKACGEGTITQLCTTLNAGEARDVSIRNLRHDYKRKKGCRAKKGAWPGERKNRCVCSPPQKTLKGIKTKGKFHDAREN